MLLIHTGNEQVPYFFLRKDVVKVCISSLIAFNGEKHKFCIWGTVPDRVFISTSYCDVPDTLISIFAQWIMLTFAPFILLNSSGLHYFFLKYMNTFLKHKKNQLNFILGFKNLYSRAVVSQWWLFWMGVGINGIVFWVVVKYNINIS